MGSYRNKIFLKILSISSSVSCYFVASHYSSRIEQKNNPYLQLKSKLSTALKKCLIILGNQKLVGKTHLRRNFGKKCSNNIHKNEKKNQTLLLIRYDNQISKLSVIQYKVKKIIHQEYNLEGLLSRTIRSFTCCISSGCSRVWITKIFDPLWLLAALSFCLPSPHYSHKYVWQESRCLLLHLLPLL